jgi:hypothetical protein
MRFRESEVLFNPGKLSLWASQTVSQSVMDIGIMSATASAKLTSSWVVNLKPLFLGGMMISGVDDDV